jgi:hypothetical protein
VLNFAIAAMLRRLDRPCCCCGGGSIAIGDRDRLPIHGVRAV